MTIKEQKELRVQFGCGLCAPSEWLNFDASPTLRIQRDPLLGLFLSKRRSIFPPEVRYGDIVRGLPVGEASCSAVYASHVLEHLALKDCKRALREVHRILQPNGRFRLIVPDLHKLAERYIHEYSNGNTEAAPNFMLGALLGLVERPRTISRRITHTFGNSEHLWMWDWLSMSSALSETGFKAIRPAEFGDSDDRMFGLVESQERFIDALAIEAVK